MPLQIYLMVYRKQETAIFDAEATTNVKMDHHCQWLRHAGSQCP